MCGGLWPPLHEPACTVGEDGEGDQESPQDAPQPRNLLGKLVRPVELTWKINSWKRKARRMSKAFRRILI